MEENEHVTEIGHEKEEALGDKAVCTENAESENLNNITLEKSPQIGDDCQKSLHVDNENFNIEPMDTFDEDTDQQLKDSMKSQNSNCEDGSIIENESNDNKIVGVSPTKPDMSEENKTLTNNVVPEASSSKDVDKTETQIIYEPSKLLEKKPVEPAAKEMEVVADDLVETSEQDGARFAENDEISKCDNIYIQIANLTKPFKKCILRGCKWSPDGISLASSSDDNNLRLFNLPDRLYTKHVWKKSEKETIEIPVTTCVIEGGPIYDFAWYPQMTSSDPSTCNLISTSAGTPVHLWNVCTGKLEATYRGYDYADEVTPALSVSFNLSGDKIFCGYQNQLKIFRTEVPGRDSTTINLKAASNQRGIISCIAFNPVLPKIFAVGSYRKSVGIYNEDGTNLCLMYGHKGGVTHLVFSRDGTKLFSGGRKDGEILCWDLRNPGHLLCSLSRCIFTNQRVYFDVTPDGDYLLTGNTDGYVSVWEMQCLPEYGTSQARIKPTMKFKAHEDCTNSCSVNPRIPILATASGMWHFSKIASDDEDSTGIIANRHKNSVKLWWMGKQQE